MAFTSPTSSAVKIFTALGFSLVLLALVLTLASGPGTRWGWWDFRFGLSLFRYAFYASAAGLSACLITVVFLRHQAMGLGWTWGALVLSLLFTSNSLAWINTARQVPRIHDITTDTQNPPLFDDAILTLRKNALNPSEYGGSSIADQQKKAYPDIQPLLSNASPDKAWDRCLDVVKKMGWEVMAADKSKGWIEATDTTFWFGFKDDIIVRVKPERTGSRIDVRSLSRVGLSDVGTNAKRIRRYLGQLSPALGA